MEGNFTGQTEQLVSSLYQLAELIPGNPATPYIETGWRYMTDNYTKFQIATWGSLLAHEVSHYYLLLVLVVLLVLVLLVLLVVLLTISISYNYKLYKYNYKL